jgi:hypothetical protein
MAVGIGGAPSQTVAPGWLQWLRARRHLRRPSAFTAVALIAVLTTTGAHADEAAAAAQIFAFEYPNSTTAATPEQISTAAHSFRASPEYQEGLHICVNNAINAIIAHTTTDANTAVYCDAFATGYAEARVADKLAQAAGQLDAATKAKK